MPETRKALEPHRWTEIDRDNPKWILCDNNRKVVSKAHQRKEEHYTRDGRGLESESSTNFTYHFELDETLIKCVPISVTKHENPFEFLSKDVTYTIKFEDTTHRVFTIRRRSLDEIIGKLASEGYIMPGNDSSSALSAVVTAFREDGDLVIDDSIETPGLYWIDNQLVPIKMDEYFHEFYNGGVTKEKILQCVTFLDSLVTKFRTGVVSTALKIGVVAPADFALKEYTNDIIFIPSYYTWGLPCTGKTSAAYIPVSLYSPFMSSRRKKPFSSLNTEARLADFLAIDTLPACTNEIKFLNSKKNDMAIRVLEILKSAIETRESRSRMNRLATVNTPYPALRYLTFSSNAPPPNDEHLRLDLSSRTLLPAIRIRGTEAPVYGVYEDQRPQSVNFR